MSDVICPRCGAKGDEQCSTARGNDHIARVRAEVAVLTESWGHEPTEPESREGRS